MKATHKITEITKADEFYRDRKSIIGQAGIFELAGDWSEGEGGDWDGNMDTVSGRFTFKKAPLGKETTLYFHSIKVTEI